jgi:hypothetical protein
VTSAKLNCLIMASLLSTNTLLLNGCGVSVPPEHYVSPQIQGQSSKINLDAVERAFASTKGKDFNSWMSAFEKRVNEIHDGSEVVSIDATRETGKLKVTGFVESNKKPGFQDGEDKLFAIEQTGDVTDKNMPYRIADDQGRTYHEGHFNLLENPFIQMLLVSQLMGGFGRHYYTPMTALGSLRTYRNEYRYSPGYTEQKSANRQFDTRFRQNAANRLGSRTEFGRPGNSYDSYRRRQYLGSPSADTSFSRPSWGGRQVFGTRRSFGRSWGGRRR